MLLPGLLVLFDSVAHKVGGLVCPPYPLFLPGVYDIALFTPRLKGVGAALVVVLVPKVGQGLVCFAVCTRLFTALLVANCRPRRFVVWVFVLRHLQVLLLGNVRAVVGS